MFVSENTADAYQVFRQGLCPTSFDRNAEAYIDYLRGILAGSLEKVIVHGGKVKQDGLFAPACLKHLPTLSG